MASARFFRSFTSRSDWRGGPFKRGMAACRYLFRSLRHWRHQRHWLDVIASTEYLRRQLPLDSRLYDRPQHPYINRQLPVHERYAIIEAHYRFLLARWPKALLDAIQRDGASVGWITLKDQRRIELQLGRPTGRGREGELALYLRDEQGQSISSLIFTFADPHGGTLLIGCVQGAAPTLGRDVIRDFTRQAYGLRPKNLLLSALYAMLDQYDGRQLLGVSNAAHPFAGQADKIKADYDQFWRECLGELQDDGFFRLPAREPVRDEAKVESKHRSTFRRREALRQEASTLLIEAIRASGHATKAA